MKNKYFYILLLLVILLFSSCSKGYFVQRDVNVEDAIVSVNGYYISASDINTVYEECKDSGVSYEKIVEDSILEILVAQKSAEYGIKLSEKELDEIILDLQLEQKDIFSEAIDIYGEENLREKLRVRNLFSRTKNYILTNVILKNGITHKDIERFKVKYHLEEQLGSYSDEQIIHDLQREIEGFLFNEWMVSLKDSAEIIYLK